MTRAIAVALVCAASLGPAPASADPLTQAAVQAAADGFAPLYGHAAAACAITIIGREDHDLDPTARSGDNYGLLQFGRGEDSVWGLSADWRGFHFEPEQTSWQEQVRVAEAIIVEYPAEARQAWAPWPC